MYVNIIYFDSMVISLQCTWLNICETVMHRNACSPYCFDQNQSRVQMCLQSNDVSDVISLNYNYTIIIPCSGIAESGNIGMVWSVSMSSLSVCPHAFLRNGWIDFLYVWYDLVPWAVDA